MFQTLPNHPFGSVNVTIRKHRDEMVRPAREHGISNLRLFGSAAGGDARPSSDIDVLIDMEAGRSLLDHIALKQDLEDLLGYEVDLVTEKSLLWAMW